MASAFILYWYLHQFTETRRQLYVNRNASLSSDPIKMRFANRLQTPHCNVIGKFRSKWVPLKTIWCKYFHLSVDHWTAFFLHFIAFFNSFPLCVKNRMSLASHQIFNRYSFECSIQLYITFITFHSLFHSFRFLIDDQVLKMVSNLWIHII